MSFQSWLHLTDEGLYCAPGRFHIDPLRPVVRAVITHGHSDHARPGHGTVLATPETVDIMRARLGENAAGSFQALSYGEPLQHGDVTITLHPAGHILGSAQVELVYRGQRAVVSGDYKRAADPTCPPFELEPCDLFITEATFALPVFRHEPAEKEVARLLASHAAFPERTHLVGAYGLGKAQRVMALLRQAGYERPIYMHGALQGMTDIYVRHGQTFGDTPLVRDTQESLAGEIVLCPPSALQDRWSRRGVEPLTAFASGWMRVRARARQRGVELPLVISDHADWPELLDTISATGAEEIWVTHGRDDALVYQLGLMGKRARALALTGLEEEGE